MGQPLAVVYNPTAGSLLRLRPRRRLSEIELALKASGGDPVFLPTRGPGDGVIRAREAAQTHSLVAALGGDGTINEVVNGVVASGRHTKILVLPGGSVNVLARDLGIPLDPCEAAQLVRDGAPRRVFLGRAGHRYFALMAGAGLDASIVRTLSGRRLKRTLGPLAFILEGIRHTFTYRFPPLVIHTGGRELRAYFAVVGKSPGYAGWFSVTPGADSSQPGFQVAAFTSRFPPKYFYMLGLALLRSLHRSGDVVYLDTRSLTITSELPAWVQLDGEVFEPLPIEFISDGSSLEFLVPRSSLIPATTKAISEVRA